MAGCHPDLLDEGAVEGAQGREADQLTDLGHTSAVMPQITAGIGNAEGIDIIVEPHIQLVAEQMGDIVFADVKLALQNFQRKLFGKVLRTVAYNGLERLRISLARLGQIHAMQKASEK